jgi:plastocyanin
VSPSIPFEEETIMQPSLRTATPLAAALAVLAACTERPTAPVASTLEAAPRYGALAAEVTHTVRLMDACDPRTFTPCARDAGGGVSSDSFFEQLRATGQVGAWHMSPAQVNALVGQTLLAINAGGRQHTFTEVEEFGGGIVPILNQLSGNPTPAPECVAPGGIELLDPGESTSEVLDEEGTERYQCCIHPWMRMTLAVREH